ncbi:serine/threonine-protein kinase DCLK3 [Pseudophryne corroboree]|uniref:serine/threonine-protein kinase DCLK3 n=1 Tax=Pseudophryne corroboree TaxID=495146 RepID=UPI003081F688
MTAAISIEAAPLLQSKTSLNDRFCPFPVFGSKWLKVICFHPLPGFHYNQPDLADDLPDNWQQSLYGQLSNNIHVRSTDMRHQVTCPPIAPRGFGKPFQGINSYTSPYFQSRNGFHTIHSENSPVKPRILTVVKPGSHPVKKITLLLNRRAVQTFEQLVADISEALGFPRWKNDRVRKLYNLKGKEIRSMSDFFRGDDVFIALGREQLTLKNIEIVLNELYPDRPLRQNKDHYEKLKYKLNNKGLNIDIGYKDTDITNNYDETMSQRLENKSDGKSYTKNRTEETRRTKKHEKFKSEQKQLPGIMKKLEICHSKPSKMLTTSLDYAMKCEHCREYKFKHRHNRDLENDTLLEDAALIGRCRKLPMNKCKPENSKPKCITCHSRCKEFSRDCSEVEEKADSSLDLCENSQWSHSRLQSQSDSNQRKALVNSKCHNERKQCSDEHTNYSARKLRSRLIENFLEDTKENVQIKGDKTVFDNDSNSKKDVMQIIDSRAQKVEEQPPRMGDAKEIFSINRPYYIKNTMDIEKYYEIGQTIGDGNFAVVKACRLRTSNEEYAMKIIDKAKLIGKEDIIENEVRIIKMLSHPNIVKLFDDFETDNEIYLILEYIKGGDLFDAITERVKFTEHNAAHMLTNLCEALEYIHKKNIVHRDIKPENLLVQQNADRSSILKLADFGLAVYATEPMFTVCGTPTYVAPEILSEKGYGLEVDMWATGVILYILLCGFPPFRSAERSHEELFQTIQCGEYEFTSPYWDNISDEAKDLISRLLVLNPRKRFTARYVLQHNWVRSQGQMNDRNLQREVTMNIERHFRNRRQKENSFSNL